jgi:hypothetical protein
MQYASKASLDAHAFSGLLPPAARPASRPLRGLTLGFSASRLQRFISESGFNAGDTCA